MRSANKPSLGIRYQQAFPYLNGSRGGMFSTVNIRGELELTPGMNDEVMNLTAKRPRA